MSLYLLIPTSEETTLPDLSHLADASQTLVTGDAREVIRAFLELAGGALSRFQAWSLVEVSLPEPDRLQDLGTLIGDQIARDGVSVLDLEEKHVTLSEVQAVAAERSYSVGLVAVIKASSPKALDFALLHTLKIFGGRVSLPMIHRRMRSFSLDEVRKGLDRLTEQGLVTRTGTSIRWVQYSLVGLEGRHWLEPQILRALQSGPLKRFEMCNLLNIPPSSLSGPLQRLQELGLVEATGLGPSRRYLLAPGKGTSCSSISV